MIRSAEFTKKHLFKISIFLGIKIKYLLIGIKIKKKFMDEIYKKQHIFLLLLFAIQK